MIPGRRFAAYGGMRRPSFRGVGGISDILLRLPTGTFSRSSTAWALDESSVLQEYLANALRTEYRSGTGLYLLEGERTNRVLYYRDATQWTVTGATTDSTSESDPAGGNNAGQFSGTTGDTIEAPLATQPADSTTVSTAVWVRGSGTVRVRCQVKDGTFVNGSDVTLTSSYQRIDVAGSTLTGTTDVLPGVEIRAASTTVDVYGFQLEDAPFPSSEIVTSGSASTRAADVLTFAASEVPERIRSGKWAFDWRPYHSNDEFPTSGRTNILQENGAALNGIRYRANDDIEFIDQSGNVIVQPGVTFDRNTVITFTVDHPNKSITVEGATAGNGTASGATWDGWASVTMGIGAATGGNRDGFAAFSDFRKA